MSKQRAAEFIGTFADVLVRMADGPEDPEAAVYRRAADALHRISQDAREGHGPECIVRRLAAELGNEAALAGLSCDPAAERMYWAGANALSAILQAAGNRES